MTMGSKTGLDETKLNIARLLMFDVSLESANLWYDFFNVILFVGAFAVAVGTYGSIKMGAVKEKFADERTAANEAATARAVADSDAAKVDVAIANQKIAAANQDIAKSNERAAALEKDAAQARLEQRRIESAVAWRVVAPAGRALLANSLAEGVGGSVEISYPSNDSESLFLASQLNGIFKEANVDARKELWKIIVQPRLFARAIFWDLSISGQSEAVVRSVRGSFSAAGLSYLTYSVPNQLVDGPGMAIGGVPPSDVMVWIGSKRPPN
jgi:hypothetical protein